MQKTGIEWTDFSANPLKYRRKSDGKTVWACVKTSPGCAHCYAEAQALRFDRGKLFSAANMEELEPFLDEGELQQMLTKKVIDGVQVSGSRCFVGDMTDVFGSWVPDALLDRLFAVFALRPDVTWQVLTKRAERMRDYCSRVGKTRRILDAARIIARGLGVDMMNRAAVQCWPLPNVWLGFSAENQKCLDERIPQVEPLMLAGFVTWLSAEPLLGPLDLPLCFHSSDDPNQHDHSECAPILKWVVVGGESGRGARPCGVEWIRSIVQQCQAAGVSVFVKQLGAKPYQVDGYTHSGAESCTHFTTIDGKGGDLRAFPDDLRVREFPQPK